jgi:hypothetical protein
LRPQTAASSLVGRVPCYLAPACSAPTRNSWARRSIAPSYAARWSLVQTSPRVAVRSQLRRESGEVAELSTSMHANTRRLAISMASCVPTAHTRDHACVIGPTSLSIQSCNSSGSIGRRRRSSTSRLSASPDRRRIALPRAPARIESVVERASRSPYAVERSSLADARSRLVRCLSVTPKVPKTVRKDDPSAAMTGAQSGSIDICVFRVVDGIAGQADHDLDPT